MARVNSFLYALRNGRYRSGKHDTDLLPESHPMYKEDKYLQFDEFQFKLFDFKYLEIIVKTIISKHLD